MNVSVMPVNTYQIAGLSLNLGRLKFLRGFNNGTKYSVPREGVATAGYEVPAGKIFRVYAIKIIHSGNAAATNMAPGYGDNDVGLDDAGGPANPVEMADSSAIIRATLSNGGLEGINEFPLFFDIPAGKFPFFYSSEATIVTSFVMVGEELPA